MSQTDVLREVGIVDTVEKAQRVYDATGQIPAGYKHRIDLNRPGRGPDDDEITSREESYFARIVPLDAPNMRPFQANVVRLDE
jgi:hypothetical protein